MTTKHTYGVLLAAFLMTSLQTVVYANLRPKEIAIIAVRGSRESEQLAEYYAEKRGIPADNICLVVMPKGETIDREKWTWAVRPEIHKWLLENDPQKEIRCLVTVWDVPLRIGPAEKDSPDLLRYKEYLEGERAKRIKLLRDVTAEFSLLAPGVALTESQPKEESSSDPEHSASTNETHEEQKSELEELQLKLEQALQDAQARARLLTDSDEQQRVLSRVQQFATLVGGTQVLAQSLQTRIQNEGSPGVQFETELERLRGMLIAFGQLQQQLETSAPSIERDTMLLDILSRSGGLVQSVKWIETQLRQVEKNETQASFDSELSLVMWPDDYTLLRWQPNYLLPRFDTSQLRDSYRTLMVARIDAPTFTLAKGLVDKALEVEAKGLQGKVYLDARGIGKLNKTNVSPGSYADFDRALLITAKGMQEQTTLDVTLDDKPELFQPGQCPDAALYCGWYSLGKYVDAFDWAPGAVAYHLASAEATTLHHETSEVWCKRLLEDGVCATLGPVSEPYLISFPRPNEFFSLLLKGELSLVECYYRTKPFNSWMQTLIGDPLYRPFAKRNVLK